MIHAPLIDLYAKGDNPSLVWFKMVPEGDDLFPKPAATRRNTYPDGWMDAEMDAVMDGALYDGDYYTPGAHPAWRFHDHGTQFALRHGLAPGQPFSTLIWPPGEHYDSHTGEWDAERCMEFNEALPWPPQWVEQSWMHFLGEQKKIRDTELAKQHVFLKMRQERVDKMVITYHVTQNYMEKVWNLELVTTITQDGNYTLPESLFAWAFKVSLADYMLAVDYKHLWDFAFEQFLRLAHEAGFNVPSPGSGYQIPRMHAHEWKKYKQKHASDYQPGVMSQIHPQLSHVTAKAGEPVQITFKSLGNEVTQEKLKQMAEEMKAQIMTGSMYVGWGNGFGGASVGMAAPAYKSKLLPEHPASEAAKSDYAGIFKHIYEASTHTSGPEPKPVTKETLEKLFEELKADKVPVPCKPIQSESDPFWDPYPD